MTSRRLETNYNQPVRFYKIIALSFLLITVALLGVVVFMSAKRATVTIITKDTPIETNLSLTVANESGSQQVAGEVVTTTVVISRVFTPKGSRQEPGVAVGKITIYNDSGASQALIATTRFISTDGILFRLKNAINVPANGTIEADVYADSPGEVGNITSSTKFTIPGLSATRQKEVYGESVGVMVGGVKTIGVLSGEDLKQAEDSLVDVIKAEGEKQLANKKGERSGIFEILDQVTSSSVAVGQETGEFTLIVNATVYGVFYDLEDIKKLADEALQKQAVDDVGVIKMSGDDPGVILDSYDPMQNMAILAVTAAGTSTLNPESKQLEKVMFFGKSKDEARRYVLSLDNVYSVDIKFSPAWINTIPQVAEHINVIIKNTR